MSFDGFLAMGELYCPLPWQVLAYDERQAGYVSTSTAANASSLAPSLRSGSEPRFDRACGQHVYGFYVLACRRCRTSDQRARAPRAGLPFNPAGLPFAGFRNARLFAHHEGRALPPAGGAQGGLTDVAAAGKHRQYPDAL